MLVVLPVSYTHLDVYKRQDKMDYKITKMFGFKVIGFAKEFSFDTAYEKIRNIGMKSVKNMRLMYMQVIHLQIHMKRHSWKIV